MNRAAVLAFFIALAIATSVGQSASPAQTLANPAHSEKADAPDAVRGIIPISLSRSLDSKKLKPGDEVDGKVVSALRTGSGLLIPSDSKIVGHVTEASARSKGDAQSSLGIAFDKIELGGGKEIAINGVVQAVAPDPQAVAGPNTGAAGSGTLAKMDGSNSATMPNPGWGAGPGIGENPGDRKNGSMLNPHSMGVIGYHNLQLNNSVLTSTNKEVKLDGGSQMLIKAE